MSDPGQGFGKEGPGRSREQKDFDRALRAQAQRRFDAAVDLWEAYAERYPDEAHGFGNLAICLLNCSRPAEALNAARRAHALSDGQGQHLILVQALCANDGGAELEREAAEYTKRYPKDFMGHGAAGQAAYGKADLDTAEQHLVKSIELRPRQGGAWATLAKVYFAEHHYEEAIDAWGKAMAHADEMPAPRREIHFDALMGMGWSLLVLGKVDRALVLAEQAESLGVNPAAAMGLRARCLLYGGHWRRGLETAEEALRIGHRSDRLRALVALEYALRGDIAKAEVHLSRIGDAPDAPGVARSLMAVALGLLGRTDEAIAELEDAKDEIEPHVRYNDLAVVHRLAGDYTRAEEASLQALEIVRDETILTTLASQYVDLGRYDEAESLLEEALRLSPELIQAHFQLGLAYAYNGKLSRARDHLRTLLSSEHGRDSEKETAADLLGRIDRNEEIDKEMKKQGLVFTSYEELQRTEQVLGQHNTLRYEQECARVATERRGKLRWRSVSNDKKVSHHAAKRQIDVFGIARIGSHEALGIGECKLKMSSPVTHGEMRGLVGRMALVLCEERHGDRRGVAGCFFSSSGYEQDALELARKHRIRTYLAVPQKDWKRKADWRIGVFKEI